MNCPACNTENPDDAQFCSQCGGPLTPEQVQDADVLETSEAEQDIGAQDMSESQQDAGPQEMPPEPYQQPASAELTSAYQAMEFAGFGPRLAAFAIDLFIVFVIFNILLQFLFFYALFVWPAYFIYLTARSGQTLGKRVMGLKVVDSTGEVPRPRRLVNRELYRFALLLTFAFLVLFGWPLLLRWLVLAVLVMGHIAVFFDPLRRSWHDRLGRTYVVRVSRTTYIPPSR